ncbi:MAG TPA: hypothetical protein PLW31_07550 [Bacteroidales bacterium]|nr:hypothetical protein [Bacteroidales bacterium]
MPKRKTFLTLFFLAFFLTLSGQESSPSSPVTETQRELENLFSRLTQSATEGAHFPESSVSGIETRSGHFIVPWQGEDLVSDYIIRAESRDYMKKTYGYYLGELYKNFIKNLDGSLDFISSDHYGEAKYRMMYHVKIDRDEFCYVYEAATNSHFIASMEAVPPRMACNVLKCF